MGTTTVKPTASFVGGNVSALETLPEQWEEQAAGPVCAPAVRELDPYRLLFEDNVQPMFILDKTSLAFLAVNKAAIRQYGFSTDEFLRMNLSDLCKPLELPLAGESLVAADWQGKAMAVWEHQRKGGASFQAEVMRMPVRFLGRAAILHMVRDVSEQRAVEQRQSLERLFATLLAQAETTVDVSRQALAIVCQHSQWDRGELWQPGALGKPWRCVSIWQERDARPEWLAREAPLANAAFSEKVWARGEPFWINDLEHNRELPRAEIALRLGLQTIAGFPVRHGRRLLGVVLFFSRERRAADRALLDTFAVLGSQIGQFLRRKQAEDELRQREELFRALIENAMETIEIVDSQGRILYSSPALERVLGYRPVEVAGRNVFEMIHPEDVPWVLRLFERQPDEPGALPTIQYRARHKDGTWRVLQAVAKNCLTNPIINGIIINSRDTTERRLAEDQILGLNNLLANRIARRTAELKAVSAELRGEVSNRKDLERKIIEISEAEQRRIGQDLHDGLNQYLASIHYFCYSLHRKLQNRAVQEADDVKRICGLLDKAMSQTRQLARGLHPVRLDQPDGFSGALHELAVATAELFSVSCRLDCAKPVHLRDLRTATHLYRIVQEAIHNAVKHGAARHIVIGCCRTRTGVTVSVRNDGRSIARTNRPSRGMGLDTMTYRAKAIGASLAIRPARPRGTLVSCTLPAVTVLKGSRAYEFKEEPSRHEKRRRHQKRPDH